MKILKASKERTKEDRSALRKTVGDIIENVIENGDAALLEYNHRFDGCDRASLRNLPKLQKTLSKMMILT